jgi:hypothetical protein
MYDEHYGDIWFEEEDPDSECYNPKLCRNVYVDLASGALDQDLKDDEEDFYYEDDYYEDDQ